jgi:two-component system, NarL family, invasion response regulator UvrY
MIRIALVDDHELVRTGIRMVLEREPDMRVVGEFANGEDAVRLARDLKPHVILMDLQLPGMSGLQATERILLNDRGTRVMVLTMQATQPYPRTLLKAGARGYLTKTRPAEELLHAIREVARGARYLCHEVASALALDVIGGARATPFEQLSPRELQIALGLTRGESMSAIARQLHLSTKTVATHKYRLFDKLGIDSEVALTHMTMQYGLATAGELTPNHEPVRRGAKKREAE